MKKYASEFLGSFAIVFFGTGTAIVNEMTGVITHAGVSLSFGLIVMLMIYTFGERSGAHFNPAVTLAFTLHRVFPPRLVAPYIISQLAGALAASIVLKMMFPLSATLGGTIPSGSFAQSFVMEFLLTFFLMLAVLNVAEGGKEKGIYAAVIIGTFVFLEAFFGGPVSGASMNPARSFGPALASGNMQSLWIYFAAPISGAAAAVLIYRSIK
jgi:aquaporin NIP